MKHIYFLSTALCFIAMTLSASAQTITKLNFPPQYRIVTAANKLQRSKFVTRHSMQKDREAVALDGNPELRGVFGLHCDITDFRGNKSKVRPILDKLLQGFYDHCTDAECYRSVSFSKGDKPREWKVIYGDGDDTYVTIGSTTRNDMNYTMACFVDTLYPDFRTCYAVEWYELDKEISGRYIMAYARIPQVETTSQVNTNGLRLNVPVGTDISDLSEELRRMHEAFSGNKPLEIHGDSIFYNGKLIARKGGRQDPFSIFFRNSQDYFARFELLRQQIVNEGKFEGGTNPAIAIYTLCKEAMESATLNDNETELLRSHVNKLIQFCDERLETIDRSPKFSKSADARAYFDIAKSYLQLAYKLF